MSAPKKIDRVKSRKATEVLVRLSAKDYKDALLAAKLSHETLPEWISSLVNVALQP
jgi:hypothetical protein